MTATAHSSAPPDARARARHLLQAVQTNRVVARYGLNAVPTARYRVAPAPLGHPARETAATLRRDGLAQVDVEALVGASAYDGVRRHVEDLVADQHERIESARAALHADDGGTGQRPFLVELLGGWPRLSPDDPLLALARHDQVQGVAEAYSRTRLKVHDVNAWVTLASPGEARATQRWHRDLLEDYDIVKCFVYIRDVPAGAGPMDYVVGTHTREGRRLRLPGEWDGVGFRVDDETVRSRLGPERVRTAEGPAGTAVFADTRGLHRGGLARAQDRVLVQILYSSAACSRPRRLLPAPGVDRAELSGVRLARRAPQGTRRAGPADY